MAAKAVTIVDEGPDSNIIAGVCDGVKQAFIDSGVDLEVLSMLRELWVSKLRGNNNNKSERTGELLGQLNEGRDIDL